MSTRLYKIHLKREGKDIEGIQKLLLRDVNRQHKAAMKLLGEVMKPEDNSRDDDVVHAEGLMLNADWIERAVNKVMKEQV